MRITFGSLTWASTFRARTPVFSVFKRCIGGPTVGLRPATDYYFKPHCPKRFFDEKRSVHDARSDDQHRVGVGLGYVLPGLGAEVGLEWVNWLGGAPAFSSELLIGYRMRGPGFSMPLSLGAGLTSTARTPRFRGSAGALIRRQAN